VRRAVLGGVIIKLVTDDFDLWIPMGGCGGRGGNYLC
jgi:hypothetical protein